MATEEDVAAGLLDWISSLDAANPISTVDDLIAKDVLWRILQSIDKFAFPGNLPENLTQTDSTSSDSWIPRWNNLKHIYDALSMYLVEDCGQRLPLFSSNSSYRSNPDLKAIAQHSSLRDAIIVLKLCVVAAANCADRIDYLQGMQRLGEATQKVLMQTLQEAQEANEEDEEVEDEDEDDDPSPVSHEQGLSSPSRSLASPRRSVDIVSSSDISASPAGATGGISELAFEERLARVIADNQRIAHEKRDLQRSFDDFQARYDTVVERHDRTQEELTEANDRIAALLSGRGAEGGKEAKNEAVIANLEARVAELDAVTEELRRNNEMLKIKADRAQKLQDDFDEIKIDRDKLSRKANAAEKYRVKLEQTQDMEKENTNLKSKVSELQSQLRQSDTRTASSSDLAREVDEYRRLLPSIEQERYEVNEMKKRLEFDYQVLQARHQESEDQLRRRAAEVEELQGRLRDYDEGIGPGLHHEHSENEASMPTAKDLETEEADFAAAEARLTEALLRANASAGTRSSSTAANGEGKEKDPFDSDDGISEDELRAIMSAMRAQMQAGTAQERESGMKVQKKLVIMLEKARTKNVALVEHIRKQSDLISDLKLRPAATTEEAAVPEEPKAPKPESELEQQVEEQEQLIRNLKMEIKLMTSAWYEQNQRMAALGNASGSGAVALMRMKAGVSGGDELRGLLGRQRKAIDRVLMGGNVKLNRGS